MAEVPIAGQIVRVTTLPKSGGQSVHVPYVVAEPDPAKAEQLVSEGMTPDELVVAVYPLPRSVVEAFALRPGEFTHWRERP